MRLAGAVGINAFLDLVAEAADMAQHRLGGRIAERAYLVALFASIENQ